MQTPKHDDDDSEFSYRLPEDSKRFLQSPRKRRLLLDGSQQQLPPSASIASWYRLPHEKTPRFQYDLKANNFDDLQYSIASGILSPKSPDSHVSLGQDELSLSAIHDTPYTDEPSVSQWELTDQLPSLPSDKLYKAIPSSVPNFIRVNQLFIWAAQLVQKQRSNSQDEKKISRQSRIADKIAIRVRNRLIEQLIRGEIQPSSFRHQKFDDSSLSKKMPHPQNEKNRQRIRELQEMLRMLHEERSEWEQASIKVFSDHAATLDECSTSNQKEKLTNELLDELPDFQKQFLDKYCSEKESDHEAVSPQPVSSTRVMEIPQRLRDNIPRMRQTLFVLQQLQKKARNYCNDKTREYVEKSDIKPKYLPKDDNLMVLDQSNYVNEKRKDGDIEILRLLGSSASP
ncbi:hypothetical protein K492DRAFT_207888 [Lichtheimia hyalospora FSU 10163]|nr:hypothetical protein K492DRAFT_207888 [Lichtheimia hyalospora FSU 10163]